MDTPTGVYTADFGLNNPTSTRSGKVTVEISSGAEISFSVDGQNTSLNHGPSTQTRNIAVAASDGSYSVWISPSPEWLVGDAVTMEQWLAVQFEIVSESRVLYQGYGGYPSQWSDWVPDSSSHQWQFKVLERSGVVHSKSFRQQ